MSPKTRARLLAQDHAAYRRGLPLRDPKRRYLLDTKKLLAIAAIAGTLLYPHRLIEHSESQSNFQYGVIFGKNSQSQQSLKESRCAELPPPALQPDHSPSDPLAYSRALVKEAAELDQPSLKLPESIQTVLARHLQKIEELTSLMVEEALEGKPISPKTTSQRLQTIRKTAEYFASKKLPSLLLYTDTAMGELLNNTPKNQLRAAEALLQTSHKRMIPPFNPTKPVGASSGKATSLFQ